MHPLGAVALPGAARPRAGRRSRSRCRPRPARAGRPGRPATSTAGSRVERAHVGRPHSSPPVAQQRGARVAGLLRVELGRRQRAVLDGGRRTARRARPWSPARRPPASASARRVGVHEVEPVSGASPANSSRARRRRRPCSSPCAAAPARRSRVDRARPAGRAPGLDTVLDARVEQHLHADADAQHRPAGGDPLGDDRPAPHRVAARPCTPRTRRRRARPGRRPRARRRRSAVTVDIGPGRSSARSAERRLPDP